METKQEELPLVSSDELIRFCKDLIDCKEERDEAVGMMMLLVWNLANQKSWVSCKDLAAEINDTLYPETTDCGKHQKEYLKKLPSFILTDPSQSHTKEVAQ